MPSALLAILLLSAGVAGSASEPAADLLLTGGKVWTADAAHPWAEAVAVREGRIVFVGRDAKAARLKGPKTKVVALRGRLVTPGFEDAHLHLMSGARNLERVDLAEETTLAGLQEKIRSFAEANPNSPWIVGRGLGLRIFSRRPPHARAARRDRSRPAGLHGLLRRPHRLGQQQGARPRRHRRRRRRTR